MKKIALLISFILLGFTINAQELKCNIQVMSSQIQGTNKSVFQTLQTSLYEFMNNRVWTNTMIDVEERIECTFIINITEQVSSDEFKGSIQVQSRRPVFNSGYYSTLFNFIDNNFSFKYVEFEPIEFSETSTPTNLTAVLAFYAYFVIGLDFDTFSPEGGTEYFRKAENIVNTCQSLAEKGWKPFDSKNNKNRYWLVKNILDEKYKPIREFYYNYHRLGLDIMDSKPDEGRIQIAQDLELLQKLFRQKPDSYLLPLQVILDSKSEEFLNVFSEGFPEEKNRMFTLFKEIDPSNISKYERLTKPAN